MDAKGVHNTDGSESSHWLPEQGKYGGAVSRGAWRSCL